MEINDRIIKQVPIISIHDNCKALQFKRKGFMSLSYKKLWKIMIDKDVNKTELCRKTGISATTMAKMSKDEPVTLTTIEKICVCLDCSVEDVVEYIKE